MHGSCVYFDVGPGRQIDAASGWGVVPAVGGYICSREEREEMMRGLPPGREMSR